MPLVLRLLGRFELASGPGDALKITGARAQLLLARLALASGDRLERGVLSTMLWGGRADAQARASLRQMIWTLRQTLDPCPDALVSDGDFMWLDPKVIQTDVAEFDRLAHSSDPGDKEAALTLYRGELLDGIDLLALEPDGYFLQERTRLQDLAMQVVASLAESYDQNRQWADAVRVTRRGLALDPFDETLHRSLIAGLQELGRPREARDQDEAFRNLMKSELGVTPAPLPTPGTTRLSPASLLQPAPQAAPPSHRAPTLLRTTLVGSIAAAALLFVLGIVIWRQIGPDLGTAATDTTPKSSHAAMIDLIPTRNLAAYDQYLRAEAERRAATSDDALRKVLPAFRRAFTLDADFANAHAGYALVAVELWERSLDGIIPSLAARSEAYVAAGRALQIDPANARALIVLSRIQARDGAQVLALATARNAVAAEPGSAEGHANLALILARAGNTTEARTELKRLQRLDPVPRSDRYLIFGQAAFADERYDAATADFIAVWPDLPRNTLLLEHLAAALALQGRLREAGEMKDRLLAVMPRANLHLTAQRYATLREPRQNVRLLEGLRRAGLPDWPYGFRGNEDQRVADTDLAAIALDARWSGHLGNGSAFTFQGDAQGGFTYSSDSGKVSGHQVLHDSLLCQSLPDHPAGEVCGPVYRNTTGQNPESPFVFVSAEDVRYFSVTD